MTVNRIALGTVQFGIDYGISNSAGQVSAGEVSKILDFAFKNKINTLDTAVQYGESEIILGNYGVDKWNIVTKIPSIPEDVLDIKSWIITKAHESLDKLNLKKVYCFMLHDPDQVLKKNGEIIFETLNLIKENNLCSKIGFSIYNIEKFGEYLENYSIDLIQVPFNIFDRRLVCSENFNILKNQGIEVHARSIFLQGLLLIPRENIPENFKDSHNILNEWHNWLQKNDINPVEACIKYVLQYEHIDKIVLGIQNLHQLQNILSILRSKTIYDFPEWDSNIKDNLINPSLWKKKI